MSSIYFNTYFFTDRSRIAILHRKLRTLILMKCQVYYERQCGAAGNLSVVGLNHIQGSRCVLEHETLPSFFSTALFQEWI